MSGRPLLQRLLDRSSDGFIETDRDGRICHANTAAMRLLHGDGERLLGLLLADFLHPDFHSAFADLLSASPPPEGSHEAALRILPTGADPADVFLSVELVEREQTLWWMIRPDHGPAQGRLTPREGISSDEASPDPNALLAASDRKYRSLVENIPDMLWTADEDGRSVFLSPNVEKLLGIPPERILDRSGGGWADLLHPDDLPKARGAFQALFNENMPYDIECRVRHANGEWRWIHERATSTYEVNGRRYADGVFADITDRKRAEHDLKIFRSMIDQANDSLFVTDPSLGRFVDANEAAYTHLGYTRDELLSLHIIDIDEEIASHDRWMQRVEMLRSAESLLVEGRHRRSDGSSYPVELSIKLIAVEDREFVVAVARDVTERKLVEESLRLAHDVLAKRVEEGTAEVMDIMSRFEQARTSQARFVADASHDLMTPLTVMRAEVDLLRQHAGLDAGAQRALDRVYGESKRLDRLASDLLMLATLESISPEQAKQGTSLPEIVLDCVTEMEGGMAKRVILDLDLDDVPEIQSVPAMLRRAVVSVIDNAVKFSPEGGIVRISVAATESTVRLEVADRGEGIPPEDLPRVFDRFYRGDRSRSTRGTGLGLPIVKAVMDLHDGEVTIASDPTTGTLVVLTFPL